MNFKGDTMTRMARHSSSRPFAGSGAFLFARLAMGTRT